MIRETGTGMVFTKDGHWAIIGTLDNLIRCKKQSVTPNGYRRNPEVINFYGIENMVLSFSRILDRIKAPSSPCVGAERMISGEK